MRLSLPFAAVLLAPLAAAQDPIPLVWYTFDDTSDPTANLGSLGATHDGDLQGDASFVAFGGGSALSLDGDGDFAVALGDENALDIGDADFSAFVRFSTTNLQATDADRGLVWKEDSGCNAQWSVTVSQLTGAASFSLTDGTNCVTITGTSNLADGQPHDLIAARTGGWLSLEVDGVCEALGQLPGGFATTANAGQLVVGGRTIAQTPPDDVDDFLGEIDEVQVFAEALLAPPPPPLIVPYGCALNPPNSLTVLSGTASPGKTITFGVDNPYGTQGPGSIAVAAINGLPAPGFPCGLPFPGLGMAGPGSMGELLISLVPSPIAVIGGVWLQPGQPAPVALPLPNNCNLVGGRLFVQGVLVDPIGTIGVGVALTSGLDVTIGM